MPAPLLKPPPRPPLLGQHYCPNRPCQILPRRTRLVHAGIAKIFPFVAPWLLNQARTRPPLANRRNGVAPPAVGEWTSPTDKSFSHALRPYDAKKRGVPNRDASLPCNSVALGRFGFDDLGLCFTVADRDLARLLCLGDFAHEVDVQQSVLKARVLDLDMIGKLEDALKGARGDALVKYLAVLLFLDLLVAFNRQRIFFRLD